MQRIEEAVVNPAVDDVHRHLALGGPDEHPGPVHDEIAPLDQLRSHQPGQQRMLVEGGAVDAGGKHDHGGLVDPGGSRRLQRREQPRRVLGYRLHLLAAEELG